MPRSPAPPPRRPRPASARHTPPARPACSLPAPRAERAWPFDLRPVDLRHGRVLRLGERAQVECGFLGGHRWAFLLGRRFQGPAGARRTSFRTKNARASEGSSASIASISRQRVKEARPHREHRGADDLRDLARRHPLQLVEDEDRASFSPSRSTSRLLEVARIRSRRAKSSSGRTVSALTSPSWIGSSAKTGRLLAARRCIRTTLTVTRWSQVVNFDCPRKSFRLRKT